MNRDKSHTGFTVALKNKDNTRGFSIVEVMITISIMSIGILALASMQVSAMRGNSFAGGVTEGSTWAGDQLEKLMNLSWDDPNLQDKDLDGAAGLDNVGFDNDPDTQADADFRTDEGQFAIHWNVADNVVTSNTKTINVIVTWTEHGTQKSVSLRRILAKGV